MNSEFARLVAASLRAEDFVLVDLGCSGGINPMWRLFGPRLRALAVDASINECKRLSEGETAPGIEYVAAFAGINDDHPFIERRGSRPDANRNPWERLSAAHTSARREAKLRGSSEAERLRQSSWWLTETADAARPVVIPELLLQRNMTNIDFLKVDTDGNDFAILNSFDGWFDRFGILGAQLEVNFCGSDNDTDRTLHNTDRFMKSRGFELFDLSMRRYSAAALPAQYVLDYPAQTVSGRIIQGDALYVRDWSAPDWEQAAAKASSEKLTKLAAIFALMSLPDCAAEILLRFKARLCKILDVQLALDMLAAQAQESHKTPLSYKSYIEAFNNDSPIFYPNRST